MSFSSPLPRRTFLKTVGAAGLALPFFARNAHAAAPSKVLRHASFGASGMAWADIQAITSNPFVKLVAVADVDLTKVANVKAAFPDVRVYQDWRQLLDKEAGNIDSVNVSTPDHMHAPIGLAALKRNLHVYGQKPLAHDIGEVRAMTTLAAEKKRDTSLAAYHNFEIASAAVQIAIVLASAEVITGVVGLLWISVGLGLIGISFCTIAIFWPTLVHLF